MNNIDILQQDFETICKQPIWNAFKIETKRSIEDPTKHKRNSPHRCWDKMTKPTIPINMHIAYILTDIESKEQIPEIVNTIQSISDGTIHDFDKTTFYKNISGNYGFGFNIDTTYANKNILTEHEDTFTKILDFKFSKDWKSNPDSSYRKTLAQASKEKCVFIIKPDGDDMLRITKPTIDTYITNQGNVYVNGVSEFSLQ